MDREKINDFEKKNKSKIPLLSLPILSNYLPQIFFFIFFFRGGKGFSIQTQKPLRLSIICLEKQQTHITTPPPTHLVNTPRFGIAGFEPVTSITPRWRATKLRHIPLHTYVHIHIYIYVSCYMLVLALF